MGHTTTTILFVLVIAGMLGLTVFLQSWRTSRSPLGKVLGIFKDLKYNEKLNDAYNSNGAATRFRTSAWDKHQNAVRFLPEGIFSDLGKLFGEIREINGQIDETVKMGTRSYIGGYDANKLQTNLADTRERLRQWIQENMYNRNYLPKKYGFFR
jgi:hypothetical protein